MRDIYSLHWHNKRKIYGFTKYDKILIAELTKVNQKGRVLEVAIGDGEPFANNMLSGGYEVYGIDISPKLIDQVQRKFPEIKASVGDAENLEFPDNYFDITYCFRWLSSNNYSILFKTPKHLIGLVIQQRCNEPLFERHFSLT